MSKQQKKKAPALPALAGDDHKDHQWYLAKVRAMREIQHRYAAAIIAAGVFSDCGEHWSGILCALAERDTAGSSAALYGLLRRLEDETPGSTRIAAPGPGAPHNIESAEDVLITHAASWGDTGFLLGLAVGMQLGPHAFDGGGR
jgi:hypothetical protein